MIIKTIWVNDREEWDEAWMAGAWDEWSIDANSSGWEQAVKDAKDSHEVVRIVSVEVDAEAFKNAFEPPVASGKAVQ